MAKFKVLKRYVFEGVFEVESESAYDAIEDVNEHCNVILGDVTSSLDYDCIDWDFSPHPVESEVAEVIYPRGFYSNDLETIFVAGNESFTVETVDPFHDEEKIEAIEASFLNDPDEEYRFEGESLSLDEMIAIRRTMTRIYAYLCQKELERLGCDTSVDPYSGLLVEPDVDYLDEDELKDTYNYPVKVYDDCAMAYCDGEELYEQLLKLNKATLDSRSGGNIWLLPCLQNG